MAYIYLRGRVWWLGETIDGCKHRQSLRTVDKAAAAAELKRYNGGDDRTGSGDGLDIPALVHETRTTYKEAVVRYFAKSQATLGARTYKRYLSSSRQLDEILALRFVDEIDRTLIDEIVEERLEDGRAVATIKRDLTFLSGVCAWAYGLKLLPTNPVLHYLIDNARFLKERPAAIEIPSDKEFDALVNRCPGNFQKLVLFLEASGLRQEEAASLEHDQVDRDRREVYLPRNKSHRARTVALTDDAWAIYLGVPRHIRSTYVFWHGTGARYENVASRFRVLADVSGYTKTCHALRHRFARRYVQEGGDKEALREILGHASLKTTERYIRNVMSARAQAADMHRIGRRRAT